LKLIGRIPQVEHQVLRIRFFEGFKAAVIVPGWEFLCSQDQNGHWQIFGENVETFERPLQPRH
jgi:hypothetical protein